MAKQRKIYIIGHKNPDTDSVCSAIAYAELKNRLNKGNKYAAKRAGQINEETEYVLKRFGVEAPGYLSDVGTQVKDMEIRETPGVEDSISIKDAWAIMKQTSAVTLPITKSDGKLEGLITTGDIAKSYMDAHDNYFLSNAKTQYRSIANTVEGKVVTGNPHGYFVRGKVVIGAAHPDKLGEFLEEDDLVRVKEGMKELGKLPSRAVLVHQKIYKENPQIGAILVAHPVHAMAFAVTDTEFDARTIPESYILLRDVKTLPYEELYLHPDQVAMEFDAAHPVVLVENDSVIVTGSSLLQAFDRLEVMELTANSILESQSLGSIVHIRDEEIDDLKTAFHLEG